MQIIYPTARQFKIFLIAGLATSAATLPLAAKTDSKFQRGNGFRETANMQNMDPRCLLALKSIIEIYDLNADSLGETGRIGEDVFIRTALCDLDPVESGVEPFVHISFAFDKHGLDGRPMLDWDLIAYFDDNLDVVRWGTTI